MSYKINWKKIKNGYKGFESLAVKYVQQEIEKNFKQTAETRDGNKDAVYKKNEYTVILGYQSRPNSMQEWWMEAKYSNSKTCIPRYKLDATLVSALLKGTVERIIIVTNMNISNQTINDIRQAIIGSTVCKQVDFCIRSTLEYWLYQNVSILKEYFADFKGETIDLEKYILVDKIKYYKDQKFCYSYKEDLMILDLNEVYRAYFTIYSKYQNTVEIKPCTNLKGIKILDNKIIDLHQGVNNIQFSFLLKNNYGYSTKKRQNEHFKLPEPSFCIDKIQIISEKNITIAPDNSNNYEIMSQTNATKDMSTFFLRTKKSKLTCIYYLYGQAGVGKKRVINNYLNSIKQQSCPFFYTEMTGNYNLDIQNIINCINYIYFPFLPSDAITIKYIKKLDGDNYFPQFYMDIIACKNNYIKISNYFFKYISEDKMLFPRMFFTNKRHIVFTNLEKANTTLINVLYKIVIELSGLNAPFHFILSGQWIQHTFLYQSLATKVLIKEFELYVTVKDCINLLPQNLLNNQIEKYLYSNLLFKNITELLLFIKYLRDNNYLILNFEKFQILYHLFFQEEIMDLYLKSNLDQAVANDSKVEELCNHVYWSVNGVKRTNTEEECKLLCHHVVKLDTTGCKIIPYNDLYARCYRKNYIYKGLTNIPFLQLLQYESLSRIQSIAAHLHTEYSKKNYIIVYYTLEPLFKNEDPIYKSLVDDVTYYSMYMDFAHSCAFCSLDFSGGKLFEKICNEIQSIFNPSPKIKLIYNAALWELTNSIFESLDYGRAWMLCDELIQNIYELITCGIITKDILTSVRYHNANVIKCLIKSEMQTCDSNIFYEKILGQMATHKMVDRMWSFKVRYSLTLMQREPYLASQLINECLKHYELSENSTEKYYLWSSFYAAYMQMILTTDSKIRYQKELIAFASLEKLQDNFFNDYRKMLYGMILYLYYRNRKDEADILLLRDQHVLRKKRPRLQGVEYLTLALHYVLESNFNIAIENLKAAYKIFKNIPSYKKLIEHNIKLIEQDSTKEIPQLEYFLGNKISKNIYYLEIRSCW